MVYKIKSVETRIDFQDTRDWLVMEKWEEENQTVLRVRQKARTKTQTIFCIKFMPHFWNFLISWTNIEEKSKTWVPHGSTNKTFSHSLYLFLQKSVYFVTRTFKWKTHSPNCPAAIMDFLYSIHYLDTVLHDFRSC